ncbi:MAG TPA: FHA domain-containing protein [Oculatellaceae cyanobacterium]
MSSNQPNAPRLPILVNLSTGERHTVGGPNWTLGRAPDNNIVLYEDGYASASHARVFWNQGWWIEDLMSSNGTTVNDQLISAPRQLAPSDVIKVGRTFFRIE